MESPEGEHVSSKAGVTLRVPLIVSHSGGQTEEVPLRRLP